MMAANGTTRNGCETGEREQRQPRTEPREKETRQRLRVRHNAGHIAPPAGGARRATLALPLGSGGVREGTKTENGSDSEKDACKAPPRRTIAQIT